MIETTVQPARAAQMTDAAFDPIAIAPGRAEPGLMLIALPGFRLVAGLRQAHALDAQFPGLTFILGRVDTAVATYFARGFTEPTPMSFQTGQQLIGIGWIAGQNAILADQAAVNFSVPDLVTELGVFGFGFAPANDGRVRFKQADHCLTRGHGDFFYNALSRLPDHLLPQRNKGLEIGLGPKGGQVGQGAQ